MERLILLLSIQENIPIVPKLTLYLVSIGDKAQQYSMKIANEIHTKLPEVILYNDCSLGNFKSQFKKADKAGADYALIIAEEELTQMQVSIKPLQGQGVQERLSINELITYIKRLL
jgi:histidyl-tRNA synthetase